MSQALIEQVRLLLHTVDWDANASDTEIMQAIDWVELRVAFGRATAEPDLEPNDYALCVHCGASHHMDEAHQCEEGAP